MKEWDDSTVALMSAVGGTAQVAGLYQQIAEQLGMLSSLSRGQGVELARKMGARAALMVTYRATGRMLGLVEEYDPRLGTGRAL